MDEISITEIQIIPVKPHNGLIAFASCVINNAFYVGNIAIHTTPSSLDDYRLVFPVKTLPTGKQINCVHPINRVAGDIIKREIIKKYKELIEKVVKFNEKDNPRL